LAVFNVHIAVTGHKSRTAECIGRTMHRL